MNLFLDTNVLIDLIDKREPFIMILLSLLQWRKIKISN